MYLLKLIKFCLSRVCVFLYAGLKTSFWWFYYNFKRKKRFSGWIFPDFQELLFNFIINVLYKQLSVLFLVKSVKKASSSMLLVTIKKSNNKIYIPKRYFYQLLRVISEQNFSLSWDFPQYGGVKIQKDDILVECGAGEGLFALSALHLVKKIYLIEPIPELQMCLERTFEGKNNVSIVKHAAGNGRKMVTMKEDGLDSKVISGNQGIKVEMLPMDEIFLKQRIAFIKIDVEGLELDVLKGAKDIIYINKPKLAIASYHDENNIWQIVELIRSIRNDYNIKLRGINYKNGLPRFIYAW